MKLWRPQTREAGFTLLEFMIAFALLSVILAAVFITQTSSLASTGRARSVLVATNLARNFLNEREMRYEGVALDKLEAKQEGSFPAPHSAYKWKLEISEVDFSALSDLVSKSKTTENAANATEDSTQADMLTKLFEDYLKKSVRRMTLTVQYPDGPGLSDLQFTELLVNYDAEFQVGI